MQRISARRVLAILSLPFLGSLSACSPQAALPTPLQSLTLPAEQAEIEAPSPVPPATRAPTNTPMPSPSPSPTTDPCDVTATPLIMLNDDIYFSWGPTSDQLDQAMISLYPQWEDFRQVVFNDPWTVGDVYEQAAYCGEGCGVNPAILLVALSMRLQWQVPPDGNLFLRAQQGARELYHYHLLHYTEQSVQEAYPHIGNSATYSLYRYFGKDLAKVREWCIAYQAMFGIQYPLTH